jgi:hypothetical protein
MRASGWRGIWLAVGLTAALIGVGLTPAGAKEKLDSFAGSCSVQGTDTFTPPATNTQRPLIVEYDASGTCSGTLNGREVTNAPVKLHSVARSNGSCPYAQTMEPGHGAITFADGTTIRYTFEFTSVGTEVDLTMQGERSGSAKAHATFLTQRTPPDVTAKCAGEGAREVPMDLSLTTDSPLVSGGHGGKNDSGPGRTSGHLRLGVRPRSVRAGRRTSFAFRVVTADGHSAPGAVVRFAGRRARAGSRGRTRIVVTLRRRGRRAVRATKPGFSVARATVRVRSR